MILIIFHFFPFRPRRVDVLNFNKIKYNERWIYWHYCNSKRCHTVKRPAGKFISKSSRKFELFVRQSEAILFDEICFVVANGRVVLVVFFCMCRFETRKCRRIGWTRKSFVSELLLAFFFSVVWALFKTTEQWGRFILLKLTSMYSCPFTVIYITVYNFPVIQRCLSTFIEIVSIFL